jgi:glycosyltransferase involved in cell wall biosynthesis
MKSLAETLPDHVQVSFLGAVPPAEVYRTLCENHVFILPTEGENFGHSIFEALQAGLPAIIANTTPWRGLKESKAGFDLPLSGPDAFAEAIDFFGEMDGDTFKTWREGARSFATESVLKSNQVARVRELFSQ